MRAAAKRAGEQFFGPPFFAMPQRCPRLIQCGLQLHDRAGSLIGSDVFTVANEDAVELEY
jgi:hypothetical protein